MPRKGKKQPRRARTGCGRGRTALGKVNTKAELGLQVVDYFDYEYGPAGSVSEGNVKHYWWNTDQNLFDNNALATSGQAASFCRVRACEVYVLPRRNLTTDSTDPEFNSNASAMYTCNVQLPTLAGYTRPIGAIGNSGALATNTQVTNILPQIDTFWKKVFACDMQKSFQSGVIRPFYFENLQCLFSMRMLDPVSGTDYAGIGNEAFKIRVKVVLHIDQPIMPIQKASFHVLSNNDVGGPDQDASGNPPPYPPKPAYCQMDLKKILHNFS